MVKLLIGGSPCTYWTIARAATHSDIKRETINSGVGWELFHNYKIAERNYPDIIQMGDAFELRIMIGNLIIKCDELRTFERKV